VNRAEDFEIAVAGAGTSGVVAALAAARQGARVALVEATGRIGGTALFGLHRFVCGLFPADGSGPGEPLHGKTTIDFCARLAQGNVGEKAIRRGRVWVLPFAGGAALEACAESQIAGETNIRVFLQDRPVRVVRDGHRISEIELSSGRVLRVKAAVDGTGTAALCQLAGADLDRPGSPALAGFGFELRGVDEREAGPMGLSVEVPLVLRRKVEAGDLPGHLAFTTWEPGSVPGASWVKLAIPADSPERAGRDAESAWAALQEHPAFRGATLAGLLPAVLQRETCHLRGEYRLTGSDVLSARKFPDGMVRNAWPVERWDAEKGVSYRYLPAGAWHDIPAGCLRPKTGPENCFCVGAAISADSEAAASIRVMGVCMALGEAAAKLSRTFF
jgi:hypothetical protein